MRGVSRFEADVLRIVSCLVHRAPAEQVLSLIVGKTERPGCLNRTCVELVQDHLRKGVVSLLARIGGWQRVRFLRNGTAITGTLWDRTPPRELRLSFSRHSLSFLMWLRGGQSRRLGLPSPHREIARHRGRPLPVLLAYESLRETAASPGLFDQAVITTNPFVRLMFPEDFAESPGVAPLDLGELFAPENAWLLETLQPWLRQRWRMIERHKQIIIRPEEMTGLGRVQGAILDEFLSQCERTSRRDLARFLLQALFDSVKGTPLATDWVRNLRVTDLRVADRAQAYQSAMAFLSRATVFQHWTAEARHVSYLDREDTRPPRCGWRTGEAWHGDAVTRTAAELVRQLDPLRVGDAAGGTAL